MTAFLKNKTLIVLYLIYGLIYGYSTADTLITHEKTYHDVYIMEGIHSFYILLPETGTIESVLKKDINNNKIFVDEPEKRIALKRKWDEKRTESTRLSDVRKEVLEKNESKHYVSEPTSRLSRFVLKQKGNASQNHISDSFSYFQEDNTNYALPGSTYPLNSSHRKVDSKAYGFYNSRSSDSLPKVVLRNPPASGRGYPAGSPMMNYGMNAFPGGGMGRMPVGYGAGGMFGDVTVISNISDLFSTIDDRLVGEFGPLKIIPSSGDSRTNR